MGGVIECVINEQKSPYLDRAGRTVGHTAGRWTDGLWQ